MRTETYSHPGLVGETLNGGGESGVEGEGRDDLLRPVEVDVVGGRHGTNTGSRESTRCPDNLRRRDCNTTPSEILPD